MNAELARKHFYYKDGQLYWKKPTSNRVHTGKPVCKTLYNGYQRVMFKGKHWYVHQIIWLLFNDELPIQIDHKDRVRNNNDINNLIASNEKSNMRNKNMYSNNKTGINGVCKRYRSEKGKYYYYAYFNINGKQKQLKCSVNIEPCIEARKQAEIKYGYTNGH